MASVYENILGKCQKYFSDDSKRFLDRQINSHLKKTPETLTAYDKTELAKWCKISGALLLGNAKAEQLSQEILGA